MTGVVLKPDLAPITSGDLAVLEQAESFLRTVDHDGSAAAAIKTEHTLFGGMYARTLRAPAGLCFVGAHVTPETIMVVQGDVTIKNGDEAGKTLSGYNILTGAAGRKSAFLTHTDTCITVIMPTSAQSVEEAESEFTRETEKLLSRKNQ